MQRKRSPKTTRKVAPTGASVMRRRLFNPTIHPSTSSGVINFPVRQMWSCATTGDADWLWWLSLGAVVAIWPVGRPSQHQLPSSSPLRPVRLSSMEVVRLLLMAPPAATANEMAVKLSLFGTSAIRMKSNSPKQYHAPTSLPLDGLACLSANGFDTILRILHLSGPRLRRIGPLIQIEGQIGPP